MPPVRVFLTHPEREASKALGVGDQAGRLRRTCQGLLALALIEAAAIAGLLVFLVRTISS